MKHTTRQYTPYCMVLITLSGYAVCGCARRTTPSTPFAGSLQHELAATAREGIPTTTAQLLQPLPPPDQNAAPLYTRLHQLLEKKPEGPDEKVFVEMARQYLPSPTRYEQARQSLKRHAEPLHLMHQAAMRPQCVFNRDWSNPALTKFPEFARMRAGVRMLMTEGMLLAHDGKALDAVNTIALGFNVASHAAADTMLIAYLVAVALDSITLSGLEKMLYLAGTGVRVAEAVRSAIEKRWHSRDIGRAYSSEIPVHLTMLEIVRNDGPKAFSNTSAEATFGRLTSTPRPDDRLLSTTQRWNAFIDENEIVTLRRARKIIGAAKRPYAQAKAEIQAVTKEIESDRNPMHYLASILLPVFGKAAVTQPGDAARAQVVRTGAAVLAWKARHGAFPQHLEEAISPVPSDPFDGKPLRYRREGNGFIVYSVGDRGSFTGGRPDVQPKTDEVVFRYPLPPYRKPQKSDTPPLEGPLPG